MDKTILRFMRCAAIAALLLPSRLFAAPEGNAAGMVIVADGTEAAARRLERVLTIDPGMGVIRHADAGYETAIRVAEEKGVAVPHRAG